MFDLQPFEALDEPDECDRCESTGRVPMTALDWDGEPYDSSSPCPRCYPHLSVLTLPARSPDEPADVPF